MPYENTAPTVNGAIIDAYGASSLTGVTSNDIGYADADGDDLVSITITRLPEVGELLLTVFNPDSGYWYFQPVQVGQVIGIDAFACNHYAPNICGSPYLSFKIDPDPDNHGDTSFGFTASDGQASSEEATVYFDVDCINDYPRVADSTVTTDEDTPYTITTADLGYVDPEDHTLAFITVTALPAAGTLTLDGVAVAADDMITSADLTDGKLIFEPDTNENGDDYASFSFTASDSNGNSNISTVTFDVTAIDDALTLTGISDSVFITEDEFSYLDFSSLEFADVDSLVMTIKFIVDDGTLTAKDGSDVGAGVRVLQIDDGILLRGYIADINSYLDDESNFQYYFPENTSSRSFDDELTILIPDYPDGIEMASIPFEITDAFSSTLSHDYF